MREPQEASRRRRAIVAEQLSNKAVRYPDRHVHRLTRRRALAIYHLHSADRSVTDLLQPEGDPFVVQGQIAARRFQRAAEGRSVSHRETHRAEERQWPTSPLELEDRRR